MRSLFSLLFSLFALSSFHAQKNVLIEKFTNFSCGACAGAAYVIKDLQDNNPNLIWVSHHKPVDWIENELNNDDSATLWWDLEAPGNPTAMVDRTVQGSRLIYTSHQWAGLIEEQMLLDPIAKVEIQSVDFNSESRSFSFDVEVVFNATPDSDRFSISAMMVEDKVETMQQHSYFNGVEGHPLEGRGNIIWDYQHRNVVRAILDGPWGTNSVIPPNPIIGESYTMSYTYVVPDSYQLSQMKIVALVSLHDEENTRKRPVMNATQVNLNELGFHFSGVQDIVDLKQVVLSPNPTNSLLKVKFQSVPQSIEIVDLQGQSVRQQHELMTSDLSIDVSDLESGSYIFLSHYSKETRAQFIQVY